MYTVRHSSKGVLINNIKLKFITFDSGRSAYRCWYSDKLKSDEIGLTSEQMLLYRTQTGEKIQGHSFEAPPKFDLQTVEFECSKLIDLVKFKEEMIGNMIFQYQFFKFSDAIVRVISKSRGIVTSGTIMSQHTLEAPLDLA